MAYFTNYYKIRTEERIMMKENVERYSAHSKGKCGMISQNSKEYQCFSTQFPGSVFCEEEEVGKWLKIRKGPS